MVLYGAFLGNHCAECTTAGTVGGDGELKTARSFDFYVYVFVLPIMFDPF